MRYLLSVSLLSLIATGALADEFSLTSTVSAATVYARGATITRAVPFDIPAGQHTLIIADIPYEFQAQTLQFMGADGIVIQARQLISQRASPENQQRAQRQALEAEISTLNAQIRNKQQDSATAGLVITAANARIKLLDSIGTQQAHAAAGALEAGTVSTETISALVALVGHETLSALQEAQAARAEIATINQSLQDIQANLDKAREALARLTPPADWSYGLKLQVSAQAATSGILQISYVVSEASWHPVYRFMLDTTKEEMRVERSITVAQSTNETWENAAITVSTAMPFSGGAFSLPRANIARYHTTTPPIGLRRMSESGAVGTMALAAPSIAAMDEPARMSTADISFQGITATYALPAGTVISGTGEDTTVALSQTRFAVALTARTSLGSAAYVMAEWKNSTDEPFLPGLATYFRDGAFVRDGRVEMVAAGATTTLGFGRVNGLEVKRTILRREDGSSGVLTTSNDRKVDYELSVKNVSGRAWDVVLYDRVPVSEQEELIVDWSARPRPTETDIDGQRGVLAWAFALESGNQKTIKLSYELQWPEGNDLAVGR